MSFRSLAFLALLSLPIAANEQEKKPLQRTKFEQFIYDNRANINFTAGVTAGIGSALLQKKVFTFINHLPLPTLVKYGINIPAALAMTYITLGAGPVIVGQNTLIPFYSKNNVYADKESTYEAEKEIVDTIDSIPVGLILPAVFQFITQ